MQDLGLISVAIYIYLIDISIKFERLLDGQRSPYLCHKPWRTTSADLLLFWPLRSRTAPEVRPETPCLLFLGLHPRRLLLLLLLLSFSRCCPCQHLRPSCTSGRANAITNHGARITSSIRRTTTVAWRTGSTCSGDAIKHILHINSV